MPVELIMCRLCSRSRPEFLRAIAQLSADYPDDLLIRELECMAACDDVPAVMLETDYFPRIPPCELIALVRRYMGDRLPAGKP